MEKKPNIYNFCAINFILIYNIIKKRAKLQNVCTSHECCALGRAKVTDALCVSLPPRVPFTTD